MQRERVAVAVGSVWDDWETGSRNGELRDRALEERAVALGPLWHAPPCGRPRCHQGGAGRIPLSPSTSQLQVEEAAPSGMASVCHSPTPRSSKETGARTQDESRRMAEASAGPRLQVSDAAE